MALIEADVLVFESVADRFRLLQQQSPGLLGAWPFRAGYFIASAELLQRFASWAEQLYAGPRDALLRTIQRYGYRVRLDTARRRAHALGGRRAAPRQRERAALQRHGAHRRLPPERARRDGGGRAALRPAGGSR